MKPKLPKEMGITLGTLRRDAGCTQISSAGQRGTSVQSFVGLKSSIYLSAWRPGWPFSPACCRIALLVSGSISVMLPAGHCSVCTCLQCATAFCLSTGCTMAFPLKCWNHMNTFSTALCTSRCVHVPLLCTPGLWDQSKVRREKFGWDPLVKTLKAGTLGCY